MEKETKTNDILSIIVTTYNNHQFIKRLLDSIMEQTYPCIELIITDDGTKDFDGSAIESYIKENANNNNIINIRILHEDINVGTVRNANRGLRNATGDYIRFLAGDDFYPDKSACEVLTDYLKDNPNCLIVSGDILDCDEITEEIIATYGSTEANRQKEYVYSLPKDQRLKYCFRKRIFPYATQSFCFRKRFFDEYGLFNEEYLLIEDSPMAHKIVDLDLEIGIVKKPVYVHRLGSGISSAKKVFVSDGIRYYQDYAKSYKHSYESEKSLKWKIIYIIYYRIQLFRIEMASNNNDVRRIIIIVKYLPSLVLYSVINKDIFFSKLKDFLNNIIARN